MKKNHFPKMKMAITSRKQEVYFVPVNQSRLPFIRFLKMRCFLPEQKFCVHDKTDMEPVINGHTEKKLIIGQKTRIAF